MRVALCCAAERGLRFLKELLDILPDGSSLTVCSFREEPHEPPFLDAIRNCTESMGRPFLETKQVASVRHVAFWEQHPFDLLFLVGWRYLVPASFYSRARRGAYVFHDSLLPRYRGFSPTVWAIINGEKETGVTLFEIAESVDSGPIVDQTRIAIDQNDTIGLVMERVTLAYLRLLRDNLIPLANGNAKFLEQNHNLATYTCKRIPEDNRIHWRNNSSEQIHNLIRAVTTPYPGAFCQLNGRRLTIWSSELLPAYGRYVGFYPGRIVEVRQGSGTVVVTADGSVILIKTLSVEGQSPQSADELLDSLTMTLE